MMEDSGVFGAVAALIALSYAQGRWYRFQTFSWDMAGIIIIFSVLFSIFAAILGK